MAGQTVMIGDDIEVSVIRITGKSQVLLGFDVPRGIGVHRDEVYHKIKAEGGSIAPIKFKRKEKEECESKRKL